MTTYTDLTAAQKQILDDYILYIRPLAGEISRTCNHIKTAIDGFGANVDDILASLDDGAELPNKSGLSGAMPISKTDVESFVTAIKAVNTTYDTSDNRVQWIELSGLINTQG